MFGRFHRIFMEGIDDKSMSYKAFLFDYDYTLAFSEPAILMCYRHVFDVFGYKDITDDTIKKTIGITLKNALEQMTNISDPDELSEMISAFQSKADEVMTSHTVIYPSVVPFFERIVDSGAKIGIVSNKFAYRIRDALEYNNMSKYVSVIIGIEDTQSHKPSPEGLLKALADLSVPDSGALYIGDSMIDCLTAKNAGVDFAAVTTGTTPTEVFETEPHVAVVSDLMQLSEVVFNVLNTASQI